MKNLRKTFVPRWAMIAVWLVASIAAQNQALAQSEGPRKNLAKEESSVAQQYARLELLAERLAELSKATQPRRAELLEQLVARSREKDLSGRFAEIVASLETDDLGSATERQAKLQVDLQAMLDLLLQEDRDRQLESERQRISKYLAELNKLIRQQRGLKARTAGGDSAEELGSEQERTAEKTVELGDKIEETEVSDKSLSANDDASKNGDEESKGSSESKDGGEKQSSDGKQSDAGQPKQGDQNKPADGQSGEQSSSGEQKEDEQKPGEQKPGDQKSGEQKSGEQKSGDSQKGEPQSGESQSGESPSEQSQSGKPQSGQGQSQGQSSPSESSESSEQQQQQSPSERAVEKLRQAQQRMKQAQERLEQAKRDEAQDEQDAALRELEQAKAELEKILRQLREEEMERMLVLLEERIRKMLEAQNEVYDQTVKLEKSPSALEHEREIASASLGRKEGQIVNEADRALVLLREDGSSVAFPEALQQAREDMQTVENRLRQVKTDQITQELELDIIATLEETLAALQQALKELREKKGSPQQGGGEPGEQPLVDQLAELRMIRALQNRVNDRTEFYDNLIEGDRTQEAELLEALETLAERQEHIFEATRDLHQGNNR